MHEQVPVTLIGIITMLFACRGVFRETVMLVNVCKALAYGLLLPWIPQPPKEEKPEAASVAAVEEKSPRSKAAKAPQASNKAKSNSISISPDAGPDVKKAVEVGTLVG